MRSLTKRPIPEVLAKNAETWLAEHLADPTSKTKKYRYRDSSIKADLRDETSWKCIYCESKIGHNTPGDVEHKVPSSKDRKLHFSWENLTIACTECNRRKNDFFEKNEGFLDPYSDPVEQLLVHAGPFVSWKAGDGRAEITVRILDLHNMTRAQLIQRKLESLERARSLADLAMSEGDGVLRTLRLDELKKMQASDSEYSACISTFVQALLCGKNGSTSE